MAKVCYFILCVNGDIVKEEVEEGYSVQELLKEKHNDEEMGIIKVTSIDDETYFLLIHDATNKKYDEHWEESLNEVKTLSIKDIERGVALGKGYTVTNKVNIALRKFFPFSNYKDEMYLYKTIDSAILSAGEWEPASIFNNLEMSPDTFLFCEPESDDEDEEYASNNNDDEENDDLADDIDEEDDDNNNEEEEDDDNNNEEEEDEDDNNNEEEEDDKSESDDEEVIVDEEETTNE